MKYAWLLALVVVVVLLVPRDGDGCGPFLAEVQFTTYHGPLPQDFASGRLGVLRPHYYRSPLLIAYRALSGMPPGSAEETAPTAETGASEGSSALWLEARKAVPGAAAIQSIDTEKKVPGADYQFYENCLGDAFQSAVATLRKRIAQWGASSSHVGEWVRAQDQVFQNCSAGPSIPPAADTADALLASDRQYQIAAAEFYGEQYVEATRDFEVIASNAVSPWHDIAPYLAARACIRQATLRAEPAKLREAAERLRAVVNDPARKQLRASAEGLLQFVRARMEPEQRLIELGDQLMRRGTRPELQRVLTDYTAIWDHMEAAKVRPPVDRSDVADWIETFQHGGNALGKWRAQQTLPWLVAALVWPDSGERAAPDLIAAAHAVKPDSPALASVTYYGILIEIRGGQADAARQWADEALAAKLSGSVVNLVRAERMSLARDWREFLWFAPRTPVALSYGEGYGADQPVSGQPGARKVAFDDDATEPLNRRVPLQLWIEASRSDLVPRTLQRDLAQAGWVRSVILRDEASARSMAERVAQLTPALAAPMRAYLAERDPAAAKSTAVFLMLRAPGMQPTVRSGLGRETPVLKRDILRDNWWDLKPPKPAAQPGDREHEALYDLYPDGKFGPSEFLPEERRAAGEEEWERLVKTAGNSVNYLCSEAIAWARAHPEDARVPEALYLAVEATHYGPADEASHAFSRQAFDLLHRGYANSEWAKKTRYWY